MVKYNTLQEYLQTFTSEATIVYNQLKKIIRNVDFDVKERLFAGQVAFYVEENMRSTFHSSPVIVIAFFKDHVNIFASANVTYKKHLTDYKFTDKDTMQIYYDKELNSPILTNLFNDSLS